MKKETTVMELISLNVGLPRAVQWKGRTVTTGIFKGPVAGRVMMRRYNLDGDRQADLSVHGGAEKAVYVYPAGHYDYWRGELPEIEFTPGIFGENLTITGLKEDTVSIGDRFRIGRAEVVVTQPRQPCYKLGLRFGRDDIIRRFLESGRSGFYLAVLKEGETGAGDAVELIHRDPDNFTVADFNEVFLNERANLKKLRRAAGVAALPARWRSWMQKRIHELSAP
ncbi:MAG TPA: MOSC domain-containing protein [Blastocatellia bacterium]|nr:MOSC domain-containing protein [Blastocatellia bacterium]